MKRVSIVLLFAVLCAALIAPGCKKPQSDEELIKAMIAETAELARAKDIKGILENVSEEYKDQQGNDRNALKGILFIYFQGYETVGVFVRDTQVTVEGDQAQAQVKVILTGGEDPDTLGGVVPKSGGGYLIDMNLVREDGDWMVIRATWTDIGFTKAL